MKNTNKINYVCARWRDAVTNPPGETWAGQIKSANTRFASFCMCRGEPHWTDLEADEQFFPVHDDQWLDVTAIPAVPREAVQAAVLAEKLYKWMFGLRSQGGDFLPVDVLCDFAGARNFINAMAKIIADHTGITPSTAEESSVAQEAPHDHQ